MERILALIEQLNTGPDRRHETLSAFVDGNSFPLVHEHQAVFFFWDSHHTEGVVLAHWVFGLESRQEFQRIEGTDAFYLHLELPLGSRVEYKLELHRGGERHWIRDPRNPQQAFDPFGSNSVCTMTGYAEPAWVRRARGVPKGRFETLRIPSQVYGGERTLRVYLPVEYKPSKSYPVMVCHDGDDYLKYARVDAVLDNLIARHEVMPMVVVFTSGGDRNAEYAANPKQAAFLVDEVLPAVERSYGISHDPKERGLMGASFGGVSSLYTAWSRPGVFGRLMLQSGSFAFTDVGHHNRGPLWDDVVAFVNDFRRDPARVDARMFLSCGTFESLIYYNRSLVPLLRSAGLQVRYVEAQDGHNWIAWRDRLREGLTYLFPGHLRMVYE